ncbi:hypothetical protein E6Q11_04730 [Candidatus Dojkabacteria bacterium]|uniref:Uncharacterized protein n=1 Tax=Candidatus Dojkabacteria bacterium TaxID=2099670 RepID=A0A5C7J6A0_9BACT|nr:MAG: hypothetical protein E6Q11_04730 [Candidatus Dojkabacteria bacterium]
MRNLLLIVVGLLAGYVQCQDAFYLRAAGVAVPDFDERVKTLDKLHKRDLDGSNIEAEDISKLMKLIDGGFKPISTDFTSGIRVIDDTRVLDKRQIIVDAASSSISSSNTASNDAPVLKKRQDVVKPASSSAASASTVTGTATGTATATATDVVTKDPTKTGTVIAKPTKTSTAILGKGWYYVGPNDVISTTRYYGKKPEGPFDSTEDSGTVVCSSTKGVALIVDKPNIGVGYIDQIYYHGEPSERLDDEDKIKILEVYAECVYRYSNENDKSGFTIYNTTNANLECTHVLYSSFGIYDMTYGAKNIGKPFTVKKGKNNIPCFVGRGPNDAKNINGVQICERFSYTEVQNYVPAWDKHVTTMAMIPEESVASLNVENCKKWLYDLGFTVGMYHDGAAKKCRGYIFSRVIGCNNKYDPIMYNGKTVTQYANIEDVNGMQKVPCKSGEKWLTIKPSKGEEFCIPHKDDVAKQTLLIADGECCKASIQNSPRASDDPMNDGKGK